MLNNIKILNYKNYYFSGIGGVSMSALAKYLIRIGKRVYGSDISSSEFTDELEFLGVKIDFTQKGKFLTEDCVFVYSSAISSDNVEMLRAKDLNIPIVKRSELLGEICSQFPISIAVSGSHGKTTTTAMIAQILISGKYLPTVFLGGNSLEYGNLFLGDNNIVLTEACEYKKNFLNIKPKISTVLNIDNDHLDSYLDLDEEVRVFEKFTKGSIAVINADDVKANGIFTTSKVSFGINNQANYTARRIFEKENGISFSVYQASILMGRINLKIKGKHNVYNALCAIAVCSILKVPFKVMKKGLETFVGVKRRNELILRKDGLDVYADYAHHPSEIDALLETYKKERDKTLFVFQPHTYSRTEILMNDFISVLSKCQNLIIYKTYPAREKYSYKGSAMKLYCNLSSCGVKNLKFIEEQEKLKKEIINSSKKYKIIIFIGAGDIYEIAKESVRLIK